LGTLPRRVLVDDGTQGLGEFSAPGRRAAAAEIREVIGTAVDAARGGQLADRARVFELAAAEASLDTRVLVLALLVLAWATAAAAAAATAVVAT
jgi:hypothetical protein